MRLVTSILLGAVGTAFRFAVSAQMAGFKMHALGVTLIVLAVMGVVASVAAGHSWLRPQTSTQSLKRDEVDTAPVGV